MTETDLHGLANAKTIGFTPFKSYLIERNTTKLLWERACSRRRWISRWRCRLIRRIREQARSHRGLVQDSSNVFRHKKSPRQPQG